MTNRMIHKIEDGRATLAPIGIAVRKTAASAYETAATAANSIVAVVAYGWDKFGRAGSVAVACVSLAAAWWLGNAIDNGTARLADVSPSEVAKLARMVAYNDFAGAAADAAIGVLFMFPSSPHYLFVKRALGGALLLNALMARGFGSGATALAHEVDALPPPVPATGMDALLAAETAALRTAGSGLARLRIDYATTRIKAIDDKRATNSGVPFAAAGLPL